MPRPETEPDIASEILGMAEADQEMRARVREGEEFNADLDRAHTERMRAIIARIGWPTESKVGEEAAEKAWLLVQHSDHDTAFQRHCLDLMKEAGPKEVNMENVAYLEDRVRIASGEGQLYGTQFGDDEEGKFGPLPIEDPEHLDERRAEMGMGSFAEYEAHMRKLNEEWRAQE